MRLLGYVKTKWKIIFNCLTLFLPAKGGISPYMSVTWPSLVGIGLRPTQNIRTLSYASLHHCISVYKHLVVQYAYYSFCLLETFEEFLSKNTISSHISFSMWPRATFYDILLQNIQVETRSVNIGKDSKFGIFEKKEKSKMLMNVMRFMLFK